MKLPNVTIAIEGEFVLAPHEVYPDGDYPDEITPEAVVALLEGTGTKWRTLHDWCLDDVSVTVYVNGRKAEAWA